MKTLYSNWLHYLIRETAVVTWVVGADGYVIDIPEWTALTGQSAEEAHGEGWMDALHPEDVNRVRSAWMTAVSHGSHYNTDYRLRCADGVYRWFNARGVPIVDVDGAVQQWIGVILSIAGSNRFGQPAVTAVGNVAFFDITPLALRAARAMLGWSVSTLADSAHVSSSTVRRLEDESARDSTRTASLVKIIGTLVRQPLVLHASADGVIEGVSANWEAASRGQPQPRHLQ